MYHQKSSQIPPWICVPRCEKPWDNTKQIIWEISYMFQFPSCWPLCDIINLTCPGPSFPICIKGITDTYGHFFMAHSLGAHTCLSLPATPPHKGFTAVIFLFQYLCPPTAAHPSPGIFWIETEKKFCWVTESTAGKLKRVLPLPRFVSGVPGSLPRDRESHRAHPDLFKWKLRQATGRKSSQLCSLWFESLPEDC